MEESEKQVSVSRVPLECRVGREQSDNKVQMRADLNAAYNVLIDLSYKLDLKEFNKGLLSGRSFLSRMVDNSDCPPS